MSKKWTAIIDSDHKLVDLKLKEVWRYRDLVWLFGSSSSRCLSP